MKKFLDEEKKILNEESGEALENSKKEQGGTPGETKTGDRGEPNKETE